MLRRAINLPFLSPWLWRFRSHNEVMSKLLLLFKCDEGQILVLPFCVCSQVKARTPSYLLSWAPAWFSASLFDTNGPGLGVRLGGSLLWTCKWVGWKRRLEEGSWESFGQIESNGAITWNPQSFLGIRLIETCKYAGYPKYARVFVCTWPGVCDLYPPTTDHTTFKRRNLHFQVVMGAKLKPNPRDGWTFSQWERHLSARASVPLSNCHQSEIPSVSSCWYNDPGQNVPNGWHRENVQMLPFRLF